MKKILLEWANQNTNSGSRNRFRNYRGIIKNIFKVNKSRNYFQIRNWLPNLLIPKVFYSFLNSEGHHDLFKWDSWKKILKLRAAPKKSWKCKKKQLRVQTQDPINLGGYPYPILVLFIPFHLLHHILAPSVFLAFCGCVEFIFCRRLIWNIHGIISNFLNKAHFEIKREDKIIVTYYVNVSWRKYPFHMYKLDKTIPISNEP